jgi:hypothetical protein
MIVDVELNSVLLEFIEINKYNRKGPCFYSASQLDDIFDRSVENINRFYTEFVNTTKGFEQEINPNSVKVYLRLFPTTGNWYIGYTMRKFADSRHSGDASSARRMKDTYSSSVIEFYKQYPDIRAMIFTIAQVNDVKSALIIESRLLRHFTNPSNNTPLPIDLCLNTEGRYCPPPTKRLPRFIRDTNKVNERGRMLLEMIEYSKRYPDDKEGIDEMWKALKEPDTRDWDF